MFSKVCFVYPWATLGGVERVLLNRLLAFKAMPSPPDVDIVFLHDSGGAAPFIDVIREFEVRARVIVSHDLPFDGQYDVVFCIDCPQAFSMCERRGFRYVAECHTSYVENRQYLKELPGSCELVISPSHLFAERLMAEVGGAGREVMLLRNFVPWDVTSSVDGFAFPKWLRKPVLFLGRLDRLKNPLELLDAFEHLERVYPGGYMCVFCGPASKEIDMHKEIERRRLSSKVLLLPPVPFGAVWSLMGMVRESGGLFVSPSRGESFGLSVAEAISCGLPVVLSDIPEHRWLVDEYNQLLVYNLNDSRMLADRIVEVFNDYSEVSGKMLHLRENFSSRVFLGDWERLERKLEF